MEPIAPASKAALNTFSKKPQNSYATITRQKVRMYAYHQHLMHRRNYRIEQNLAANGLRRGQATSIGNNCLLHTLFQQIAHFVPKETLAGFIDNMRARLERTKGEQLSINDEEEGKAILVELQRYLFEKTGQNFCFDLTVLFADNEGDLACVEMFDITVYLQRAGERIPLRMIAVNYNHYEPLFPADDPSQLIEPLAALGMQEATPRAETRTLPAYVINMPIKVDSDDEGASSDEEEDQRFPAEAFEQPSEYFRLLPKDSKATTRGEVLEILTPGPNPSFRPANSVTSVIHLCEKEADSLQKDPPSSVHRLAMCVGFNKMKSLSSRRNRSLNRSLNASYEEKLPMGKIGFFWNGIWQRKDGNQWATTTYEEVRAFYKQLKRRHPEKARQFQSATEKSRGHMVSYREIRDAIKNHAATRGLIRQMREEDRTRDVYLTFLDSDIKSFQQHPGAPSAFEVFDENYLESRFEICSTGYTVSEPDNPILELGVLADMTIRDSTGRHIKRGVYYPEPCTAVKVLPDQETVLENFGSGDRNYSSPMEMPRLINEVLHRRKLLAQQAMRFDMRGAIVTTTPGRMQRVFLGRRVQLIGVILWNLPDFKTMSDINQSHFNARDWALNIIPALSLQREITIPNTQLRISDQKVLHDVATSLLARLFKAHNPIERALHKSQESGSFQRSLIELLKSGELVPHIERSSPRKEVTPRKNVKKDQEKERERCLAVNRLWQWADAIETMPAMTAALDFLLNQNGSSIRKETILQAAEECGRRLMALFKARLCLNYTDLVVDALAELLDIDYKILRDELPALFRSIMEGYHVPQGSIQTTRQDIAALPEFYYVTPLHIAALAGNIPFVLWLISDAKNKRELSENSDIQSLYPLDYGLAHCKNNGVNLQLLSALWKNINPNNLKYFAQVVLDELEDNGDRFAVLHQLLEDKGAAVIHIDDPDLDLLVSAVIEGYEELAERLFECGGYPKEICQETDNDAQLFLKAVRLGFENLADKLAEYNDYESELFDEMLEEAPDIDKNLLKWALEFDIVGDIREELGESDCAIFNCNLENLGVADEASEAEAEDFAEEEEERDEIEEILAAGLQPPAAIYDESKPPDSPSHKEDQ